MIELIALMKTAMTAVDLINTVSQAVEKYNSEVGSKSEIDYDSSSSAVVSVIKDPLVWLPPRGAEASRYVANLCQTFFEKSNIAVAVTGALKVGNAMKEDYQHGTVRNTVEAAATLTGGYLGASLGASAGADFGERIFPGVGELLGGAIGAIAGGIAGANTAQTLSGKICDANERTKNMPSLWFLFYRKII